MGTTILRMLSTNSLTAFSAATTTQAVGKAAPIRLVRDTQTAARTAAPELKALPKDVGAKPERGSLLDLRV